jgi:tRNA1(Val) A37 N6-methylase TrmN6
VTDFTRDSFLNGRITLRQPAGGFRSGLDAVMLAAAVPMGEGGELLELGAGAGVASLCVAARLPGSMIVGVEIDDGLAELANANAQANNLDARVRFVAADALSLPAALKREFAQVFSNPPFHAEDGEASPHDGRRRARQDGGRLPDWLEVGLKRTVSGGTFTAIIRADRLGEALSALPGGGITVYPLWPRTGEAAKRVIVRARKGARTPPVLLPGLVLHEADGRFTPETEDILRGGASLALDKPRL